MNREDIIRMAREAGWTGPEDNLAYVAMLGRFAALVAHKERETCAQICVVLAGHPEYASDITKLAAQAIMARGKND